MIEYWPAFLLLIVVALVFVIVPLLVPRRQKTHPSERPAENVALYQEKLLELEAEQQAGQVSAEEFSHLKLEFDRLLLQDTGDTSKATLHALSPTINPMKWLGMALLICLPIGSLVLYGVWGANKDVELVQQMETLRAGDATEQQINTLLGDLEHRAAEIADNDQYWNLLARSYMGLQQYDAAARSYKQLAELFPEDSAVLALYAQALYLSKDRQITPEVQIVVDRVLAMDPHQKTLLGMLGMDAYEKGRYGKSVEYWSRLLAVLPADSADRQLIQRSVERARAHLATSTSLASNRDQPVAEKAAAGTRIAVSLKLSEKLETGGDHTVYLFAKAINGPPMPLAVARLKVSDLPTEVLLDDSMAMSPALTLSSVDQVNLVARVSMRGDVAPQPGDFQGEIGPVEVSNASTVTLTIDQILGQ